MPHLNICLPEGIIDPHRLKEERVIEAAQKICNAAKLPLGRTLEIISIINLMYDGSAYKPKGMFGVELRTLGQRYVDKPYYRMQWKFMTHHCRAVRIFIQQNRDSTYTTQLYIPCKDTLIESSASTWQELSLLMHMMIDQFSILDRHSTPRHPRGVERHHPKGYRKV